MNGKSEKGKRWGSKWTRGKRGAPAPHGQANTDSETSPTFNFENVTCERVSVVVEAWVWLGQVIVARLTGPRPVDSNSPVAAGVDQLLTTLKARQVTQRAGHGAFVVDDKQLATGVTLALGRHTGQRATTTRLSIPRPTAVRLGLARTSQREHGEAEALASSSGDVHRALARRVPADDVTVGRWRHMEWDRCRAVHVYCLIARDIAWSDNYKTTVSVYKLVVTLLIVKHEHQ